MQYNPTSILLTIIGLYLVSYVLVSVFTFVHLGCTKVSSEVKGYRVLLSTALVSLGWLLATFLSLIIAKSFGLAVFSILSLVLIFGTTYFIGLRLLPLKGKSLLIYSLIIAIIFNPGWLSLFKVL